jgi:hypothetical protein
LKEQSKNKEQGFLADKFKQAYHIPHINVWEGVEANLETKKRRKAIVWWTGLAAGICFLLGLNLFVQIERAQQNYHGTSVQSASSFSLPSNDLLSFYRVLPPSKDIAYKTSSSYSNLLSSDNAVTANINSSVNESRMNIDLTVETDFNFDKNYSYSGNSRVSIDIKNKEEGRNWFIGSQAGMNMFSQSSTPVNTLKSANGIGTQADGTNGFSAQSRPTHARNEYSYSQNPGVNIHLGRKINRKNRVNIGFGFQQFAAEREMNISSEASLLEKKTMELYATEIGFERDLINLGSFNIFGELNLRHLSGRSIRSESTIISGSNEEDIEVSSSLSKTRINTSGLFAGINKQINRFTIFVKGGINYKINQSTSNDGPKFPIADESHKAYSSVFLGVRASI